MIKENFNLICLSLKFLVIYRLFGCQRPTQRQRVIRKMGLKFFAITHAIWFTQRVSSVYTLPVIILCQRHLLKVNVKSLAFGGLKDPVTCQIVAVVARETRRDNSTVGGVFYHPSTRCYNEGKTVKKEGERLKREKFAKCSDPQLQPEGLEESPSLCKDCITSRWTAAGPQQLTWVCVRVRSCVVDLKRMQENAIGSEQLQKNVWQNEPSSTGQTVMSSSSN